MKNDEKKIKVSIVGATGYSGKELIRILLKHPYVEIMHLVSASYVGKKIAEIFPDFLNQLDRELIELDTDKISRDSDLVFTALPHTVSMKIVPDLLKKKGLKVIDISADFRLKNPDNYAEWYQTDLNKESQFLLKDAVYGLPEIYAEKIKKASLIANPGCYPTSAILGVVPLLFNQLVSPEGIIVDAKSGTSGAGRKLSLGLHFTECNESFKAYKCLKHNHIPEIEQELSFAYNSKKQQDRKEEIKISFTPHLLPINRGILSTCYLNLVNSCSTTEVLKVYEDFYKDAPFIRIFKPPTLPEIRFVEKTNYCDIGFAIDDRTGIIKVISVIDNLTKGASGQAIQNMNIMFGFPEKSGLIQCY
ncbi:MAG: N-acetyl-gamma-glutamyl-phosphate reductase [Atribacterota bacterium]|nr:N-acetyl-gamma-glutamyl-phosphate reductase [Atribacterota bacterium]